MKTKLTSRLDEDVIAEAKGHSAATGRSLSQLVSDYFRLIGEAEPVEVTPRVRALRGVLCLRSMDESEHRRHLEAKHR